MTLHHEAVVLSDNRNAPGHLRKDQRYHQDQLGWIDIAYHVGVDRNGNIYELRSTKIAGDTATDYDTTGHFLVLCEGDFDQEVVPEAQLHGAALVFAWAAQTFGIASSTLAGHRDLVVCLANNQGVVRYPCLMSAPAAPLPLTAGERDTLERLARAQ
ncbi:N-acetylmuramoyl-L-alanine amidase, partial [Mycobacterium sp.]|uniref:N-acetylmuramoyl-L-alanine amidase n=1 Tax=Mycobacterium sp. TaxID=1785 RepID=UPI003D6B98A7